jgi:hypothetical protein
VGDVGCSLEFVFCIDSKLHHVVEPLEIFVDGVGWEHSNVSDSLFLEMFTDCLMYEDVIKLGCFGWQGGWLDFREQTLVFLWDNSMTDLHVGFWVMLS